MNSQYVQTASINSDKSKGGNILFTNLSSQQQNPGTLNQWFTEQNHAMRPMPFTNEEIPQQEPRLFGEWFDANRTEMTLANKVESIDRYFDANVRSTKQDFNTPSQRAWGVPMSQVELRETDMF